MTQILNRETLPQFMRLIPNELKTRIYLPGTVVVGELIEDGDTKEPAAVLVLTMSLPDEIGIEWIWVEEEFREEGLGENLLMIAFDIAKADDRKKVTAKIYTGEEENFTDAMGAMFFLGRQFAFEREEELWTITKDNLSTLHISAELERRRYLPRHR